MAKVLLTAGAEIDVPTRDEVAADIGSAWREQERARDLEHYRGIKSMAMPSFSGTAVGGVLTIGQKEQVGPRSGYAWSVMKLIVTGLTSSGASPDVLNFYLNDAGPSQPVWWQLNGNQFGETFGKLHMVIRGGNILLAASLGSFAATGTITVTGEIIEVPGEQLSKLV